MTTPVVQQAMRDYLRAVRRDIANGIATEHTYRPALKSCLESLHQGITATTEPKRIECGAPDFVISRKTGHGLVTIGYLEAKDVGPALLTLSVIPSGRIQSHLMDTSSSVTSRLYQTWSLPTTWNSAGMWKGRNEKRGNWANSQETGSASTKKGLGQFPGY